MMGEGQDDKSVGTDVPSAASDNSAVLLHEKALEQKKVFSGPNVWTWDVNQYACRKSPLGIEVYDIYTGQVLAVQNNLGNIKHTLDEIARDSVLVRIGDRDIYVDPSVPLENLEERLGKNYPFSPQLCELICEQLASGKSPLDISKQSGFPSTMTMRRWRNKHKEFDDMWRMALQDFAEEEAREAREVALEVHKAGDPDLVPGAKLLVDTLRWSAEKSDAEKYGTKVKVSGEVKHSVSLVVDTGIRRLGDQGFTAPKINQKVVDITPKVVGELPDVEMNDPRVKESPADGKTRKTTDTAEPVDQGQVSHTDADLEESGF